MPTLTNSIATFNRVFEQFGVDRRYRYGGCLMFAAGLAEALARLDGSLDVGVGCLDDGDGGYMHCLVAIQSWTRDVAGRTNYYDIKGKYSLKNYGESEEDMVYLTPVDESYIGANVRRVKCYKPREKNYIRAWFEAFLSDGKTGVQHATHELCKWYALHPTEQVTSRNAWKSGVSVKLGRLVP